MKEGTIPSVNSDALGSSSESLSVTQDSTRIRKNEEADKEKLDYLNLKMEEVRKKQRMKKVLQADLMNKGASAKMAQSYVMSLDSENLSRFR